MPLPTYERKEKDMNFKVPNKVLKHLESRAIGHETPIDFVNRAIDETIHRDKIEDGVIFGNLPHCAVIDVVPNIGDMMILITFADGDRRLFNASYFKDNPNFKPISTPSDVACAYVEGCTVAWKDKEEMFFELPPGFLYQHSVSLSALGSAVTQELDRAFDEERNRFYCKSLNETAKEQEDRLKNNRLSDNFAKDKVAKKKKSRTDEEIQRELNEAIESIRPELENLKPLDEDVPISDDNAAKTEKGLTKKEIQQINDAVNAYFS